MARALALLALATGAVAWTPASKFSGRAAAPVRRQSRTCLGAMSEIGSESGFDKVVADAGDTLVVVDFVPGGADPRRAFGWTFPRRAPRGDRQTSSRLVLSGNDRDAAEEAPRVGRSLFTAAGHDVVRPVQGHGAEDERPERGDGRRAVLQGQRRRCENRGFEAAPFWLGS